MTTCFFVSNNRHSPECRYVKYQHWSTDINNHCWTRIGKHNQSHALPNKSSRYIKKPYDSWYPEQFELMYKRNYEYNMNIIVLDWMAILLYCYIHYSVCIYFIVAQKVHIWNFKYYNKSFHNSVCYWQTRCSRGCPTNSLVLNSFIYWVSKWSFS